MHLVNSTTAKNILALFVVLSIGLTARSQENSPYSRYGIGDIAPTHNMIVRGMGGISSAYADGQSVNFVNPASYGSLRYNTVFDIGVESNTKTLKSITPQEKFKATNLNIAYLQLALPIKMAKANKKDIFLGVNIGLRPISRINYKIQKNEYLTGIDTLETLYEGSGGLNQAFAGAGLNIKDFSVGFNLGYAFGNKSYSTTLFFPSDTVYYYRSNSATKANFKGFTLNAGMQYEITLSENTKEKKRSSLRLGVYGNLKQTLKATEDIIRETIVISAVSGEAFRVDSVYESLDNKGEVIYPASIGIGALFQNEHWTGGLDFETTSWKSYRYFNKTDLVQNSWKIKGGAEYLPATPGKTSTRKYASYIRYRAGFYYGPDYIKVTNTLPEVAFTFGFGLPLKLRRTSTYETQFSILNTSFEIGSRGNKQSNIRESFFRIGLGLSLNDIWFQRYKYN